MNSHFRTALIAGASALIAAGAVAAAVTLPGDDAPAPRTVKIQEAGQVDDTIATSTTKADEVAVTEPTLAPGFEDFKPGDALPTRPEAPRSVDEPVQTVPGPYGPIYPDGYANDADDPTTRTAPPPPPPAPIDSH
jgi:hypothetical protein